MHLEERITENFSRRITSERRKVPFVLQMLLKYPLKSVDEGSSISAKIQQHDQ